MRVCAIGDPHGDSEKIKKISLKGINLILLTGDLGKADFARKRFFENVERKKKGLEELEYNGENFRVAHMEIYNSALGILKYLSRFAPAFTIFGNADSHDAETRKDIKKYGMKVSFFVKNAERIDGLSIINNRIRNFNGIRIGGLEYFSDVCWVREFKPSDYSKTLKKARKQTAKAKRVLERFGKNLDVLVCHQPPYGYLDKVEDKAPSDWRRKHTGSKVILDYIKKHQPRDMFFVGIFMKAKGKQRLEGQKFIIWVLQVIK